MALDEHAGCEIRARLWGGSWNGEQRIFVDLDFVSAGTLEEAWAAWERREVAAGATGSEQMHRLSAEEVRTMVYGNTNGTETTGPEASNTDADDSGGAEALQPDAPAGAPEKRVVRLDPIDSVYASDTHGHSLSVEQAEILAGVLRYLVRATRDGDVEALRTAAKLI